MRRPSLGPPHGCLETIGMNPPQHTEGRGEPAGRGRSPSLAGASGICGPGRTGCARRPEALLASRKRREPPAGAVGACCVNAEDRSGAGRGCGEVSQEKDLKDKRAEPLVVR